MGKAACYIIIITYANGFVYQLQIFTQIIDADLIDTM
jgi:hypothetical protein